MFKKVLIAEDHESANISVQKTLVDLSIKQSDYVFYCDDALLRIKKGIEENHPYDLLITDLYFEEDHRTQQITSGDKLVEAAKAIAPNLKVVVFSAENKPAIIETLFNEYNINAYVRKGRHDAKELKLAIECIYKNKKHLKIDLKQGIKEKNSHEFTVLDINIISLLSKGVMQKDIPIYLKQKEIRASSLSSLEKRLNLMKEVLNFNNNEQLIAFCKDMGII